MNIKCRFMEALVDIAPYIIHDLDKDQCAACVRWDELQLAALAMVQEVERLENKDSE